MHSLRLLAAVVVATACACLLPAQSKKESAPKSPADLAAESFFKLARTPQAKPDLEHLKKVISTGLNFVGENPTHAKTMEVINVLAGYPNALRSKEQKPFQAVWATQLKVDLLNWQQREDLSADVRAALAAVDASVADIEVRMAANNNNLATFRTKIDHLAKMPGGERFLAPIESSFVEVLKFMRPAAVDGHLQKLATHPNADVAKMAKEEININDVRKAPYELKFTALDGREVDFAALRGKVVLLSFWSTSKNGSRDIETLKGAYANYRKRGFEIVGVSYDKEEDREKLAKYVKEYRVTWPQYFDGKEDKNEFGRKLNVRRGQPANFLFDQNGMLVRYGMRGDAVEGEVKRLLNIK